MKGGRVNHVTLSRGRLWVGKDIAEMGVTSLGVDLRPLHVVRSVQALGEEIFGDRFGERWKANAGIEFVDRSEERFAGNDIDVDAGLLVIPKLILKSPLGAILAHDGIFLGLQSLFQDGIAGDRTVRVESCGLLFLFLREKEKVKPPGDEYDCESCTDVRADRRFLLAGNSAPAHQMVKDLIESDWPHPSRQNRSDLHFGTSGFSYYRQGAIGHSSSCD